MGEVGKALHSILKERYEGIVTYDKVDKYPQDSSLTKLYDCIHICFPCQEKEWFVNQVNHYKFTYLKSDGLCIIHSTVPLGTSDLCDAVHSPIRGQHPNLEKGIRTFTKYFGGKRAKEACGIFEPILKADLVCVEDARTTEALKLWDTAQYAWNILLEKEIHRWCEENKVDFELVYTHANHTYNDGYKHLSHDNKAICKPEFLKYILDHVKGGIGGHCLLPNCKLLESWISDTILVRNNWFEALEDNNNETRD
jgi:hypothetical protein